MPRKSKTPLVNILIEPELLEALDEWRFSNRFPSRAAAMKWLIATRLVQKPVATPEDRNVFNRRSA